MRDRVKVINRGSWGAVLFFAWIGAAVYFVKHAHTFWGVVWGLLQSLVWPAFVVYHVLGLLHVSSL